MNIVILDKLDFPDDCLESLRQLGTVTVYSDYPDEQQAVERLVNADIAILGWTTLNGQTLERLPKLKCIALALTGYEVIDLNTAREKKIIVCNVPGYSRQSVAEYAFAMVLAALRHVIEADRQVRGGNALSPTDSMLGHELYQKTLGILGLGSIGSWIARIGQGFGMQTIGFSRNPKNLPGIRDVSLDELLSESDVLAVAVDTNSSTSNILSADRLQTLKAGSVLVNITSNQVLDEEALANLLASGHIAAAAFDDISHSGHDDAAKDRPNPLVGLPNVVLSPQAGWYTIEAERRLMTTVVENVKRFVDGNPVNVL